MNCFETEETRFIAETAGRFAAGELSELNAAEREGKHNKELWDQALASGGQLGFFLGPLPADLGGTGMDAISRVTLVSKIARTQAGFAVTVAIHYAALAALKGLSDREEARKVFPELSLPGPAGMPRLLSLAFPEEVFDLQNSPGGSFLALPDPSVAFKVVLLDSNRGISVLDPAGLLELRTPAYPGSGLDELPRCRLDFRQRGNPFEGKAEIPKSGVKAAGEACRAELKLLLSAAQAGNAAGAQAAALAYTQERKQTGRLIIDHQEVRRVLSQSEMLLRALESFILRAALDPDSAPENGIRANDLVFRFTCQSAERICLDAVQTLGGYGYMKDYGLEKRLRDAKTISALSGSFLSDCLGD